MDEVRPGYYAVIPADVRYDDKIPANAKLLYGEISALIGSEGFCFATNQYFAKIYGFSAETVARLISKLEKEGYIKRELERDKSGQVVRRKLYLSVSIPDVQPLDNFDTTPLQKNQESIDEKVKYTNTSNTNILKENKKEKSRKEKHSPLTDEQLHDIVVDGISNMAPPDWPKDIKDELYRLIMSLYDPQREVRKAHPVRSEQSVKGTFRKLLLHSQGNPLVMIDMLCSAITGGWQGVQPPSGSLAPNKDARPPREERQYKCV